jgi:MFS family permease
VRGRLGRILRALAVDADLLRRRRELRLLIFGQSTSLLGSMITFVAIPVQVYDLTGSTVAVGLLGVAEFVPILALALVGGALADAFDRRRLVMLAEAGSIVVVAGLVVNAALEQVWFLYVAAALSAAFSAIRRPPLDAMLPRLVEREELKAASALNWGVANLAQLAGPALGGLLIAWAGFGVTYAVDLATFVVSLFALAAMQTPPPTERQPVGLKAIGEGLRYAASRQELLGTYVVDIVAMFFAMPMALFPALAESYGGGAVVGLLYAAPSAGAVLFLAASGWTARVHHHGRAIVIAAAAYGGCIALVGVMPDIWLVVVFLAAAGAADMISGIFRGTIWSQTIPESMRGRLAGIEMLSYSLGPLGGQVRAGVTADLWSVRGAIVSGGLACVAGVAVTAAWLRDFWSYDARTDEHAVAERAVRQAAGES